MTRELIQGAIPYLSTYAYEKGFEEGANYVLSNAWQEAQGENLPPIDKEVVVLCQDYPEDPEHLRVAYGHRPNPEGWTGKNIITGEVKHHIPQIYDKGGWNIPNVKFWLDIELPNK